MAKRKNSSKLYVLPALILFGIITFSSGQFGSYGSNANLFLQPTTYNFPSGSGVGSFFFSAAPVRVSPTYSMNPGSGFLSIDYRSRLPTAPAFYHSSASPIIFNTYAAATPVQPIYFTPTRALYDVRYTYDNFRQIW